MASTFFPTATRWPLLLMPCAVGEAPSWRRRRGALRGHRLSPLRGEGLYGATWATAATDLAWRSNVLFELKNYWFLVWNMNFIFQYIGDNHPNWLFFILFRGVGQPPSRLPFGNSTSHWMLLTFTIFKSFNHLYYTWAMFHGKVWNERSSPKWPKHKWWQVALA